MKMTPAQFSGEREARTGGILTAHSVGCRIDGGGRPSAWLKVGDLNVIPKTRSGRLGGNPGTSHSYRVSLGRARAARPQPVGGGGAGGG